MNWNVTGGLVLAFALVWFLVEWSPPSAPASEDSSPNELNSAGQGSGITNFAIGEVKMSHPSEIDEGNTDHRFTRFQDGVSYWHHTVKLSHELHRQDQETFRDLEIIDEILSGYRLVYQENPVGTDNEEFAAALAGENPKKVVFIDPQLLVDGELLDRYGSPYVFHPLKSDVMDLRSRGEDGQLWTVDDVSLGLQGIKSQLGLVSED